MPSVRCVTQKRGRSPGSPYEAVTLQASQVLLVTHTCTSGSDDGHLAAKLCFSAYWVCTQTEGGTSVALAYHAV